MTPCDRNLAHLGGQIGGPAIVTAGPAPCKPQDEVHAAGSGLRFRLVSDVVSFAWVRGRPPGPTSYGQARSRTGVNPGERWSALLESALGATPREFESRILRSLDLRRRAQIMFARCATARSVCLIFCLSLSPGHMPYSGQIGVMAR